MKFMREGKKSIELRLYDEKRKQISVGDRIVFVNTEDETDLFRVTVLDLFVFSSFDELYKKLPLNECGYTEETVHAASPDDMGRYYSKEQQLMYGVVGIKICPDLS